MGVQPSSWLVRSDVVQWKAAALKLDVEKCSLLFVVAWREIHAYRYSAKCTRTAEKVKSSCTRGHTVPLYDVILYSLMQ